MRRLLVTGLQGFVGWHVEQAVRNSRDPRFELVEPSSAIEIRDLHTLKSAVKDTRPDCVLHLAAQSFIPESTKDPRATYEVNFFGTLNLLEALKSSGFSGRMLYVGSADIYGAVSDQDLPIVETHPLRPRTPYGVSKAAAELLCYQWTQDQGFDSVMTRSFNHIGPGQAEHFVVPDFAKQIAEIKLGRREPVIKVGDIDVTRDFTDVRDVVAAYLALIDRGVTGEVYNVCSGREYSIRDMLNELIRLADVQCSVVSDVSRLRTSERRRNRGSFDKLRSCTSWEPRIPVTDSLRDVLAYWTKNLASK